MIEKIAYRMLKETPVRIWWKLLYNFCWKGRRAVNQFERRLRRGQFFPAFIMLSLTDRCNLSCQGCWVTQTSTPRELSIEQVNNVIAAANANGSYFFGLLGGEPLLYPRLFELIAAHPDCYFQLFTNGTLLDDETAVKLRQLGNVTPLISLEGYEQVSDIRRGGDNVYDRAVNGIAACSKAGLVIGVAASICQSNFSELVRREFAEKLIERGVHYLWYYIYRPSGANPCPELALTAEQIVELRRFIVELRGEVPLVIVDAYWDGKGNALCPGAVGLSIHISPGGDIEFCPPIQFAVANIGDGTQLEDKINQAGFMADFRAFAAESTRGCVLMEKPQALQQFLEQHQAYDCSGRNCGMNEIAARKPMLCHHLPGQEIPEKNWLYRFAKKYWFFGFGTYG